MTLRKSAEETADDLTAQATSGATAETEAPPSAPASVPEPAPVVDVAHWQAKLDGMRGTAIKYQKQAERLNADLLAVRQEFEDTRLTLEQERDQLRIRTVQLEKEAQEFRDKATRLEKRQQLSVLIQREYPALADLYHEGLMVGMESMDEAQQVEYLTRYAEKLSGLTDAKTARLLAGALPPTAPATDRKSAAMTPGDAWNALEEARIQHGYGSKEYQTAYHQYVDLVTTAAGSPS